ncbi:hypothetical protein [Paraflavitalea speifideaquila]|uniref:hypothetical protein n=1 Tax=Paraflavitalea speifideaquila TaxID=3076558 RepID=UPI0028EC6CA5|nr:hypothetical protein [Paraflavitalea speifideiaquila]
MRLLKSIVILWVMSLCAHTVSAQYYFYDNELLEPAVLWEAGVSIGAMNCFTDLGGKKGVGRGFIKDLNGQQFNFSGGFYVGALYQQTIGGRLEATFGTVSAADNMLTGDVGAAKGRYMRNLHFRSKITELALLAEFHPLTLFQSLAKEPSHFSPYIVGGVGIFHFNPEAFTGWKWVALQPLRTEGQGFTEYPDRRTYQLTQANFPMGIGVKYEVSAWLNARLEIMHRVLTTDYLDDVSKQYINPALFAENLQHGEAELAVKMADRRQELDPTIVTTEGSIRGNPKDKDAYFTIQFKLSMSIGRTKRVKF